jgi:hypothetical protein
MSDSAEPMLDGLLLAAARAVGRARHRFAFREPLRSVKVEFARPTGKSFRCCNQRFT